MKKFNYVNWLVVIIFGLVSFAILGNQGYSFKVANSQDKVAYEEYTYETLDVDEERDIEFVGYLEHFEEPDFRVTSSDESIFTVENGKIKGISPGIAVLETRYTCGEWQCSSSATVVVGMTDQEILNEFGSRINRSVIIYYDSKNETIDNDLILERVSAALIQEIPNNFGFNYGIEAEVTLATYDTTSFSFKLTKDGVESSLFEGGTYLLYDIREHWSLYFENQVYSVQSGETIKATYYTNPEDMEFDESPFVSEDVNIFVVDGEGNVTGVSQGIARLYVTTPSGTASCLIMVDTTEEDLLQEMLDNIDDHFYVYYDSKDGEPDVEAGLAESVGYYQCVSGTCFSVTPHVTVLNDNTFQYSIEYNGIQSETRTASYDLYDWREHWYFMFDLSYDEIFSVDVGETKKFPARTSPEDMEFDESPFSSSNEEIFTVNEMGHITGVSPGVATLSVQNNSYISSFNILVGYTPDEYLMNAFSSIDYDLEIQYGTDENKLEYIYNGIYEKLSEIMPGQMVTALLGYEYDEYLSITLGSNNTYSISYNRPGFSSFTRTGNYTLKGIYVNSYDVNVAVDGTYDLELAFTEGDIYNLAVIVNPLLGESKDIVSVSSEGVITGLANGKVELVFQDAYGRYWTYVNVVVGNKTSEELENAFEEQWQDYFDENVLDVTYDYNNYDAVYSINNLESVVRRLVSDKISESGFDFTYTGYDDVYCDIDESECTYYFYSYGDVQELLFSLDININLRGIYNKSRTTYINEGQTFKSDLYVYGAAGVMSATSLNPEICSVSEDLTITGVSDGVCIVKYTLGEYQTIQSVVVNKNSYKDKYLGYLNGVNKTLNVPIDASDSNSMFKNYEIRSMIFGFIDDNIVDYITDGAGMERTSVGEIKLSNTEYLQYNDYTFSDDLSTVKVTPQFRICVNTVKENEYCDYDDSIVLGVLEPIEFTINYTGSTDELRELATSIREGIPSIPSAYDPEYRSYVYLMYNKDGLTGDELSERYLVNWDLSQSTELLTEVGFFDDLHIFCADCEILPNFYGGVGYSDGYAGLFTVGGNLMIAKNGNPVVALDLTIRFFNDEKLVIRKSLEPGYTYSVTDIELSKTNVELENNGEETITATVVPENASYKELTWSSDDENVAHVDENGKITAVGNGTTTVRVVSHDTLTEKTITVAVTGEVTEGTPVYRLYNPYNAEHLYTTDANEVEVLYRDHGWGKEGIGWYSSDGGTPIYRLYNPGLGNHLYTSDENEIEVLTTEHGWVKDNNGEPVMYSTGNENDIPIYRVYNESLSGMHHLTTDENEYNVLPDYGWQQEGISMYAAKIGAPETTHYYNEQ